MTDEETQEFLEHYGVKGMKWGVRKDRKGRRSKSAFQKLKDKSASDDRTRYKKSSDAPARLTDAELEKRIKRLESEKKYNELNSRTVSQGEKLVTEVITNAGRKVATVTLAGAGLLVAKKFIAKKFGPEIADSIPKLKKM